MGNIKGAILSVFRADYTQPFNVCNGSFKTGIPHFQLIENQSSVKKKVGLYKHCFVKR